MSKLFPTRLCCAVAAALMLLPALAQADLPVTYKDGARAYSSPNPDQILTGLFAMQKRAGKQR